MARVLDAPLKGVGEFFAMTLDTFVSFPSIVRQGREFIEQSWFIARVSTMATVLVAIPFTVLVTFILNILLRELGAADLSGASAAFGTITQIGPMVTVLIVAGAGATALCADLGSRTIHDEISALEVMGVDPVKRLVVPRVWASAFVGVLLNGLVCTIGILGGFLFSVLLQGVNPGAFVNGITLLTGLGELILAQIKAGVFGMLAGLVACYKGLYVRGGPKEVGSAVNETVVFAFMCLFVVNTVITAVGVKVLGA